jgi:hypothetical protein
MQIQIQIGPVLDRVPNIYFLCPLILNVLYLDHLAHL